MFFSATICSFVALVCYLLVTAGPFRLSNPILNFLFFIVQGTLALPYLGLSDPTIELLPVGVPAGFFSAVTLAMAASYVVRAANDQPEMEPVMTAIDKGIFVLCALSLVRVLAASFIAASRLMPAAGPLVGHQRHPRLRSAGLPRLPPCVVFRRI